MKPAAELLSSSLASHICTTLTRMDILQKALIVWNNIAKQREDIFLKRCLLCSHIPQPILTQ